ncbi:MAG: hypothetical protein R3F17_01810 [Planctomycetota bacterium]
MDPLVRDTFVAKVSPDGSFRVAVSKDTTVAQIQLYARYNFLRKPTVWKTDDTEPLVLKPTLGAIAAGRIVPPVGWQGDLTKSHTRAYLRRNYAYAALGKIEADGSFEWPAVDAESGLSTLLHVEGLADHIHRFDNLEPGKRAFEEVHMDLTATIRGTVVDENGEPISTGQVFIDERGPYQVHYIGPRADGSKVEKGAFVNPNVGPGDYVVLFSEPGYLSDPVDVDGVRQGDEREVKLIARKGHAIEGVVQWQDGTPAANVTVRLIVDLESAMESSTRPEMSTETDENGRFQLSGFENAATRYGLLATGIPPDRKPAEGLSKLKRRRWERENTLETRHDPVAPGTPPITMVLGGDAGLLAGLVVNDAGEPIPRFRVSIMPRVGNTNEVSASGQRHERFDSEDGTFELPGVAEGQWGVRASASGHEDADWVWTEVPRSGPIRLVLPRSASIAGRLETSDGKPVEGWVRLERTDPQVYEPSLVDSRAFMNHSYSESADSDGHFEFSRVSPGAYTITAFFGDLGSSDPMELTVTPGSAREDIVLRLPPSGRLYGRVPAGWLGAPLSVTATGDRRHVQLDAQVEQDGRFEFPIVPADHYQVRLVPRESVHRSYGGSHDGEAFELGSFLASTGSSQEITASFHSNMCATEVEVGPGQSVSVQFPDPPETSVIVTGRVLDGGKPAPNWRVEFTSTDSSGMPPSGRSDESGTYRTILPKGGTWQVRLKADRMESGSQPARAIEIPDVRTHTLDFELPSAALIVKLRAPSGKPLDSLNRSIYLNAVCQSPAVYTSSGPLGQDGIRFSHLSAGTYTVIPKVCGFPGGITYAVPATEVTVGAGEQREITITLEPTGSLRGTITGLP